MFASKLIEYFSEIKLFYLFVDFHQVTYYKEESSLLSSLLKCLNAGSNVKRIIAVSSGIMQLKESPLPGYLCDMIYNFLFTSVEGTFSCPIKGFIEDAKQYIQGKGLDFNRIKNISGINPLLSSHLHVNDSFDKYEKRCKRKCKTLFFIV